MMNEITERNQTATRVFLLQLVWDYFYTTTLVNNMILKNVVFY